MNHKLLSILSVLFIVVFFSCRKEDQFTTDPSAKLKFSSDTLMFDTVFSQVEPNTPQSVTKQLWVINPNSEGVRVNIQIKGTANGTLKLNIDGKPGNSITGKEIRGNDSIVIFVQFFSNPGNGMIITDQLLFETNGNVQDVDVVGVGMNTRYFRAATLDCSGGNLVWTADTPYLIYGSVLVPEGCKLTIEAGTKIYSFNNSAILVGGTLVVNGTKDNPVVFQGTRIDNYFDIPTNQWRGIWFLQRSIDNVITGAIIKNALVGVEVDSVPLNGNPNLTISQCLIKNMAAIGIYGISANIRAFNNVVVNCTQFNFLGYLGGTYNFYHNTFGIYEGGTRSNPQFVLDNSPHPAGYQFLLKFNIINNIIFGSQEEEILINNNPEGKQDMSEWNVDYNLLYSKLDLYRNGHNQVNPRIFSPFRDPDKDDYHFKDSIFVENKGIPVPGITTDFLSLPRSSVSPTIGAYE